MLWNFYSLNYDFQFSEITLAILQEMLQKVTL